MNLLHKLIASALGYFGKKLDGKKTYLGGAGLILTGVVGLLGYVVPDQGLPQMEVEACIGYISGGLAVFGIGHKVQKSNGTE